MALNFEDLGLSQKALQAINKLGYVEPTPVQAQAIPMALRGCDILAAAQTGTGKTASFALPSMDRLGAPTAGAPRMLVITPTRELAMQIGEVTQTIAEFTHQRIVTVVGGLSYRPQTAALKRGCDILIATPGRLIDLMDQKAVNLKAVEILVLDEADRMLDMGFLPAVKRIISATPKSRQTLLFSATIDRSIMSVAESFMNNPETVEIARKGDVTETIDHFIIRVPHAVKPALLNAVLQEHGYNRVIIFARTRSRADSTMRRLRRAGFNVEAIHSDRSQNQRKRALERFASGEVNIIVATDVLARGIDVDEVDYVVNLDVPDQPEDYIHRIGRTGRAGAAGMAITFVTTENERELKAIEKLLKAEIPTMTLKNFNMEDEITKANEKAQSAKNNRDPEVRKVKRAMGNSQKTNADRNANRKSSATSKGPKSDSSKASKSSKPATSKGAKPSKPSKPSNNRPAKHSRNDGGKDLRPGRASRAAARGKRLH